MPWCNNRDDDLRGVLEDNIGRVCTIFPTSGGRAGDGFTGVLSDVNGETCTLISLDSFTNNGSRRRNGCGRCGNGRDRDDDRDCDFVRRMEIFPLDRIACITTTRT